MKKKYISLNNQSFSKGDYFLVPIRYEDRFKIMKWRNEQVYHLRQSKPLTEKDQNEYFENVIIKLFDQKKPKQILFSYLKDKKCIGYGGLVHIDWLNSNAEISFIMDTDLEKDFFLFHWNVFLELIEKVAFLDLKLHKIRTYAYDLRPKIYEVLENAGFEMEGNLREHYFYQNKYINILIHSKINNI